ncbi:YidC/Oxa1 family membrane protein insertase [Anaerovibrio slackiae]|uniref:YidC/Oxa1 family membrane protein insertase n=1 Tax=Anaerovibrio slackiae TaxID=2652309 RepID=UPI003F151272
MNFYDYTIFPIECVYKAAYLFFYNYVHDYGIALICLSLFTYCLTHPLQNWAAKLQHAEKELQEVLSAQIAKIKSQYDGVERHNALKRLYKRYGYHPIMAVRSAIGVGMQIPFLMAAFYMLSELPDLDGVKWFFLENLKEPDQLFYGINVMPFVMTLVNILSAVTTEGFSRKDIKQAGLVALVFLILLYDAPSALLVYWTMNNLISLGTNILQRFLGSNLYTIKKCTCDIFTKLIRAEDKVYLVIIWAFIWTIGFWVPLDIFFRNTEEFWFGINDIFHWLILINVVVSVIAIVMVRLIKTKNILNVVGYVFFVLLLDVCIQSYMLNVSYGVLDGRSIDWGSYGSYGLYNALLWAGIIFVPLLLLFKFKLQQIVQCCAKVSVMLLIIQGTGLLYYVTSTDCIRARHESAIVTTRGLLDFSQDENIIVIILDTFDSSYMQELLNSDYGDTVRSVFKDFTYYPDTVGMYPTTKGAVPHIMTGEVYKNEVPFSDYIENAYDNNLLYKNLRENDYVVEGYSSPMFFPTQNRVFNNVEYDYYAIREKGRFFQDFYQLVIFRMMPHCLKKYFLLATENFAKYRSYEGGDLYFWGMNSFYKQLGDHNISINEKNKKFKIYHLQGVHPPYKFDESLQSNAEVRYGYLDVSKGCISLLKKLFVQLETNNVFRKSNIIVLADHGNKDMSQNPLLLIKNKDENHDFAISAKPVSYKNLNDVFEGMVAGKSISEDFFHDTMREYLYYVWDNDVKGKFLPSIKHMICKGEAFDIASYYFSGMKYGDNSDEYILGDWVDFSLAGNSLSYVIFGFGWQESWGTWTCAKKAEIDFLIGNIKSDLQLDIEYQTFNERQRVNCYVGDTQVAHFTATGIGEQCIYIPKKLVENERIIITLELPDATSPNSLGISEDNRELGLGIKKMRISEIR